ncbi:MAG TPA: DUF3710 domain-containing protein [Actinomycetes bacterium]|nr:DUF3710 domain-containing protein [Actinomycetes bacterium]
MFRRRRNDEATARQDGSDTELDEVEADTEAAPVHAELDRSSGPWDVTEVEADEPRLDLGSVRLPAAAGMEVQLQLDEASGQVVAVLAVIGQTALQLQAFAAPRTEGIWDEVRAEIAAGLTGQGGTCSEAEGPFGAELRAQVPATLPDGTAGFQQVRFLGVDGPRWFLRGVVSGAGAVDAAAAAPLEDVFRRTVVVRGDVPMAPRTPIPLHAPQAAAPEATAEQTPESESAESAETTVPKGRRGREALKPFERGPEITEIR